MAFYNFDEEQSELWTHIYNAGFHWLPDAALLDIVQDLYSLEYTAFPSPTATLPAAISIHSGMGLQRQEWKGEEEDGQ